MLTAVLVAAGYIAGSMPWGYWLVRIFRGEDVRTKGSGNIGASNVWRVYGWKLGLPAMLLDTATNAGMNPFAVSSSIAGRPSFQP